MKLRVSKIVARTAAEGPGLRFAVWTQGCPLNCPGCCNPEMQSREGGVEVTVAELLRRLAEASGIEGITLLGGEPFWQPAPAAELARQVRARGLSVVVFTGFDLVELEASLDPAVGDLLGSTDLLIAGRYRQDQPESRRRWIGSRNQSAHWLSDRYSPAVFDGSNSVEIRFSASALSLNGWPGAVAALERRLASSGRARVSATPEETGPRGLEG